MNIINCFNSEEQVKEPEYHCSPTFDGLVNNFADIGGDTALQSSKDQLDMIHFRSSLDGIITDLD